MGESVLGFSDGSRVGVPVGKDVGEGDIVKLAHNSKPGKVSSSSVTYMIVEFALIKNPCPTSPLCCPQAPWV